MSGRCVICGRPLRPGERLICDSCAFELRRARLADDPTLGDIMDFYEENSVQRPGAGRVFLAVLWDEHPDFNP